ncbi:uncharacterized protein LOC135834798 [Planococcus citri]|uniref:uncharacterized protein LOC135834798 n=1 Tax=Planococcus citri TaxID=170843 RepID=UPI0031F7B359
MCVLFSLVNLLLFVTYSSQSSLRIVSDDSSGQNDTSESLKNDADHAVIKHLHKIYNSDLKKKDTDVKQLLLLKQQYIVRNHIEEFETDFALSFVPDWSKVDKWSSPARQSIEIRRQKWEFIFDKHSDLHQVQSLAAELAKGGVNQSTFCREIAEAYFILSHNSYVYNRGPMPNTKDHKVSEYINDPMMEKSLKVFMHIFPDSNVTVNEAEELVQIPKSVYHKLLRKDTHVHLLRKHHDSEMRRQKDSYENKIKEIHKAHDEEMYTDTEMDTDSDTDTDTGSSGTGTDTDRDSS